MMEIQSDATTPKQIITSPGITAGYNATINTISTGGTTELLFFRSHSTGSSSGSKKATDMEVSMNESDKNFIKEELKNAAGKPPWWAYTLGSGVIVAIMFTYHSTTNLADRTSRMNIGIVEKMDLSHKQILNEVHNSNKELLANITASNKELTASINNLKLEAKGKEK